jgi:hypothetical protein
VARIIACVAGDHLAHGKSLIWLNQIAALTESLSVY